MTWTKTGATVLGLGLALALFAPALAHAGFAGGNGEVAFATTYFGDEGAVTDIWSVQPDGSGLRRLTDGPGIEEDPAWSPNGRRIAFSRGTEPRCCARDGDIWVMEVAGLQEQRVTAHPANDIHPSWSPDGSRLVFSSSRDDSDPADPNADYNLYIVNRDGTGLVRLTSDPVRADRAPAWSPDGTTIVFEASCARTCPPGPHGLWTVSSDGTPGAAFGLGGFDADWAPDGTRIAFTEDSHVWTMHADGGSRTRLPQGPHFNPAWSPDGTRIAFTYGNFNLLGHVSVAGSDRFAFGFNGLDPTWQPLGPRRGDFKNGPAFCHAEREFLGAEDFAAQYRNFGRCVSSAG